MNIYFSDNTTRVFFAMLLQKQKTYHYQFFSKVILKKKMFHIIFKSDLKIT